MFYIVDLFILFFFYLKDINKLGIKFYNVYNKLVNAFSVYILV